MPNDKESTTTYYLEVKGVIETLLKKLNVPFEKIEVSEFEPSLPKFVIQSSDSGILIGHEGDHLKAISHIVRKIVFKKRGLSRFSIDINNYQEENIRKIKDLAISLSKAVKESGESAEMPPMSSYERMIIHTLFTPDSGVVTESVGERNERRVIIKVKNQKSKGKIES